MPAWMSAICQFGFQIATQCLDSERTFRSSCAFGENFQLRCQLLRQSNVQPFFSEHQGLQDPHTGTTVIQVHPPYCNRKKCEEAQRGESWRWSGKDLDQVVCDGRSAVPSGDAKVGSRHSSKPWRASVRSKPIKHVSRQIHLVQTSLSPRAKPSSLWLRNASTKTVSICGTNRYSAT
jgi:hypothetical protein